MIVRELFGALGLDVDEKAFAVGAAAFGGVAAAAMAFLKVVEAVASFVPSALSEVTDRADRLDELAQSAGVSAQSLQELGFAAKFSGVEMTELSQGLAQFAKRNPGKDVTEGLLDLADKMAAMPDRGDRVRLAFDALGRAGTKLVPVLSGGRAELQRFLDRFNESGLRLTDEQIKRYVEYADAVEMLKAKWQGFKQQVANAVLPTALKAINFLLEKIPKVVDRISLFFRGLMNTITMLVKVAIHPLTLAVLGTVAALYLLQTGAIAAGASFVLAGLRAAAAWALAAAPVLIIVGLLALLLLVIEDVQVMLEGGESLIGKLGEKWADFVADWMEPKADDNWLNQIVKTLFTIFEDLEGAWDDAIEFWKQAWRDFVDWIVETVSGIGNAIADEVTGWFDFLPGVDGPEIRRVSLPGANARGPAAGAGGTTTISPRFDQHITINGTSLTPAQLEASVVRANEEFLEKHFRNAFVGVSQ